MQIHHLDDDPSHNSIENLAVLCLDCHNETMISGGFHRKLDAEQIRLYRDEWVNRLGRYSDQNTGLEPEPASHQKQDLDVENFNDAELKHVTTILDQLREKRNYVDLAIHYDDIDNKALRDKYINKVLQQKNLGLDSEVFLRSMQGRVDLVSKKTLPRRLRRLEQRREWGTLARIYRKLGWWIDAAAAYSKYAIHSLEEGNIFSAAFYLQEMTREGVVSKVFEEALRTFKQKDDLWWQYRALQELGRDDEAEALLVSHRQEIESSDRTYIKAELYKALGDQEKANAAYEQMARESEM